MKSKGRLWLCAGGMGVILFAMAIHAVLLHQPRPLLAPAEEVSSIRISATGGTGGPSQSLTIDGHFPEYLRCCLEEWGRIQMEWTGEGEKEGEAITIAAFDDSGRILDYVTVTEHGVTKKVSLLSTGCSRIVQGANPYEKLKQMLEEKRIDLIQE